MSKKEKIQTVEQYIAQVPPDVRETLEEIRRLVKQLVPGAVETISYQLPALRLDKTFFYYAAFKHHIGVYPPVTGDEALQRDLAPYRNEKGNLRFPLSEPIPFDLIGRVAVALAQERGQN